MSTPNTPSYYLLPDGRDILDITLPMSNACGNALKYLKRAGLKPGEPMLKDLKKALDYLVREYNRKAEFNTGDNSQDYDETAKLLAGDIKARGMGDVGHYYLVCAIRSVLISDNAGSIETRQQYLYYAITWLNELIKHLEAQND